VEQAVVRRQALLQYLESKAYKMHIRVLLSKYRSYTPCEACGGARLKTERCCGAWAARKTPTRCSPSKRFMPVGVQWSREQLEALPGLSLHDLMILPIERLRRFFDRVEPARRRMPAPANCRR
jgi:excinuclease ABC subunit A